MAMKFSMPFCQCRNIVLHSQPKRRNIVFVFKYLLQWAVTC